MDMGNRKITYESVTQYINRFYKPLSPELQKLRAEAEQEGIPVILKEAESFLVFLMKLYKPRRVLEIGTAIGYSAMVFASLGAHVVSVEKDGKAAAKAKANLCALGFENSVEILEGDGAEAISHITCGGDKKGGFDFVFIDAAKSHYKRFLEAALPKCKPGALVVSDNVLLRGDVASDEVNPKDRFATNIKNMRGYLEYISSRDDLDVCILTCGDGLALCRYTGIKNEKN